MGIQTPRMILNAMIDEFQKSTHNLLRVSKRDLSTFDKGQYGLAIAKLSRRLESVLSVDREVVVVFSNFTQQQARTIRFARKIIHDEDVRLEPTLAIIVHKDPRGNEKLKNWGRQNGLTVLPVYFKDSMPSGEWLEKALSLELFSHDLFDVRKPVSDDSEFYGRRTEAQDLARKLQVGQIRACLGLRKIGKTSIIHRVINQLRNYHDAISIVVDCSKDAICSLDANDLMWSIADCVQHTIDRNKNYGSVSPRRRQRSIAEGSERLISTIRNSERVVVIFMDEVDYITPTSPVAAHWQSEFNVFWRNFRAVYQELSRSSIQTLSLLICGVSSKWFAVHAIDGIENAALSLVPEEYLSPLPRGASTAMIKEMSRASGLVLDEDARLKIAEVSADIPFWIRKACSYIHRSIDIDQRPYAPPLSEIDDLLSKFIDYEGAALSQHALSHLFSVYPELEEGVYLCSEDDGDRCSKNILGILSKYGIIATERGRIGLSGDMMQAGFEAYLEARTSAPQPAAVAQSQVTLDDWAEDLAIVNRKRNILERKLQETALYFLTYDILHVKSKVTVADRILKAVQPGRRELLSGKSNEELIKSLLWSELYTLVGREWKLFEPIFSDRKRFLEYCEIANDRPDAHAKPIDPADFALYRRVLDWLTGKLIK